MQNKYEKLTEQELKELYRYFEPKGSGPLGMMKVIRDLIIEVARLRQFDTSKW